MTTQLIAEIGQAHDGSLGILHSYIDALADCGIQTVKFQMHIAHAESSIYEPFRTAFSYEDKTRMDYWKRMEFSFEQWQGIKVHCEERQIEFLATPFSMAAVEQLEKLNVRRYKIGSGDVNNLLLLERVAQTGKPILLSSGMSDWTELDVAVVCIRKYGNPLCILQCTTAYPCEPEQWGLNNIAELKRRYQLPVGYSDHSGTIHAGIAACALGAEIIEVHVSFDRRMFGPDSKASLLMDEVQELKRGIQLLDRAQPGNNLKENNESFRDLKLMFGKSLASNKKLDAGHILKREDLETKKPMGKGIPVAEFGSLIGKKLKRALDAYEFINWSDVE